MPDCPPRSYGSFCPVAQGSEVVAQRWVPLILREIMVGHHQFNQIRHALPLISPSMLSRRLKSLEDDGVIRRSRDEAGAGYRLTPAGEELRPIVEALGQWARKWVTRDYHPYELDPAVLMWSLRRHVLPQHFPPGRTVLQFQLTGAPRLGRYWWIVVKREEEDVDVCLTDPGYPVALTATGGLKTLVAVLMGDLKLGAVLQQGLLRLEGDRDLARRFELFFQFTEPHSYAGTPSPSAATPAGETLSTPLEPVQLPS